ncbi:unnamed protein product [Oikopleura dioica]|uniref:Uncharacterized protein n=1 Tax=Oikopleura dioica TaxID=34765 RepID=E4Z5E3_OIKDI|nr:unnamed protein product [Oikopleura dioica]
MKRTAFVDFLVALVIGYILGQLLLFAFLKNASCLSAKFLSPKNTAETFPDIKIPQNKSNVTFQLPTKPRKKRIFIAIHSTPEYLKSRGQAIKDSWLQEIDERIATVRFISAPLEGFPTFTLPDVNDYDYPPQKKSFKDRMKKSYIKIIKTVRFLQLFSLLMLFTKKFKKKKFKIYNYEFCSFKS